MWLKTRGTAAWPCDCDRGTNVSRTSKRFYSARSRDQTSAAVLDYSWLSLIMGLRYELKIPRLTEQDLHDRPLECFLSPATSFISLVGSFCGHHKQTERRQSPSAYAYRMIIRIGRWAFTLQHLVYQDATLHELYRR
nr:hypothetical protein CFP56_72124 [Quercus suber]